MRARLGYFSFILAFFLCTSLMFVFLAQARADAGPDSRAFLVEKRYYAISDMEYAMYQGAGPALEEAKDNVTAAKEILDAAAIEFPFLEPVAQGAKMEDAEIAKRLVLYRLIQDSGEISSNYPDYDVKFWCGPLNQPIKQAVLDSMLATGSAQYPQASVRLDSPLGVLTCADFMEINTGNPDGSWSISFNDPTGNVLSDNEFGHVGIGISVYDRELNQSSASIITRIRGVHAP